MDPDHYAELIPSFLPENRKLLNPYRELPINQEREAKGSSVARQGEIPKYTKKEIDAEILSFLQRDRMRHLWYPFNLSAWVREGRFGRTRWISGIKRLENEGKISIKAVEEPPLSSGAKSGLVRKKYFKIN